MFFSAGEYFSYSFPGFVGKQLLQKLVIAHLLFLTLFGINVVLEAKSRIHLILRIVFALK
jgi:hypothetical protein